jgi:hypothetical protein
VAAVPLLDPALAAVLAGSAVPGVLTPAAVQLVVSRTAVELVGPASADEGVLTGAAAYSRSPTIVAVLPWQVGAVPAAAPVVTPVSAEAARAPRPRAVRTDVRTGDM